MGWPLGSIFNLFLGSHLVNIKSLRDPYIFPNSWVQHPNINNEEYLYLSTRGLELVLHKRVS